MFINLTDINGRPCFVKISDILTASTSSYGSTRVSVGKDTIHVVQSPSEILALIRKEEKKDEEPCES